MESQGYRVSRPTLHQFTLYILGKKKPVLNNLKASWKTDISMPRQCTWLPCCYSTHPVSLLLTVAEALVSFVAQTLQNRPGMIKSLGGTTAFSSSSFKKRNFLLLRLMTFLFSLLLAVVLVVLQFIHYLSVVHLHMYLAMCSEDKSLALERGIRGRVINNEIHVNNVEGRACDIMFVKRHLYLDTEKHLRQFL
jgi:hypothetical protein